MRKKISGWLLGPVVAALVFLAPAGALGEHNPNGWIQTSGWNLLFPLLNPWGCTGGGAEKMKTNWIAPVDIGDPGFNPRGGDKHSGEYEDFDITVFFQTDLGTTATATGAVAWNFFWETLSTLELRYPDVGPFPNGDVVDFQALVDRINLIPLRVPPPSDNVLGLATTYVENPNPTPLEAAILTASDDSIQVWVNDVLVTNVSACRGLGDDWAEANSVVLPPGVSKIAVLVWQGVGGWGFRLGISGLTDADQTVLRFLGRGEPGDNLSGQPQYRVLRSTPQVPFNCPTGSKRVSLRGQGPGDPAERLTVREDVDGGTISDISHNGSFGGGTIFWEVTRGELNDPGVNYTIRSPAGGRVQTTHGGTVLDEAGRSLRAIVEGPETFVLDDSVETDLGPAELTSHDVGFPQTPGSATYSGGEYTLTASGADIWEGGDEFHFAYKEATGDFEAVAHVTSRTDPVSDSRWGKHGLMARYSCDANAKYSMVQTHLASEGEPVDLPVHAFRVNHLESAPCRENYHVDDWALPGFPSTGDDRFDRRPEWMKLVRKGNAIYSYLSFEDANGDPLEWCLVGSDTDPRRPGTLLVGMALTAHTGNTVTGEIRFDHFELRDRLEEETPPECTGGEEILGPFSFDSAADDPVIVQRSGDFEPAVTDGRLRLTEDGIGGSAVAVWLGKVSASGGFVAEFDAYMEKGGGRCDVADNPNPGDGMTFAVIQAGPGPDALGTDLAVETLGGDGSLGYEGGTLRERTECHPSFAVELDTWVGGGEPHTDPGMRSGSPNFDCYWHMGVDVNGSVASIDTNADFRLGDAIAINFAADEPDPTDPQNSSHVDGPAGYFGTAVWNNLEGPRGGPVELVNGVGSPTGATVTWASNNTWASTGRGEENNTAPPGEDRDLMTGYLDTDDTSSTRVTVEGLPYGDYFVYAYIKGGVNDRGGVYGQQHAEHTDTTPFDGKYKFRAHRRGTHAPWPFTGDVVVLANSGTLLFFAEPTIGTPPRAPLNALEIVPVEQPGLFGDIYAPPGVRVQVRYRPTGHIDVFLPIDEVRAKHVLSTSIPPLEGDVVLGFTAGTGGATSTQEIDNFVVYALDCDACEALPEDPPAELQDAFAFGAQDLVCSLRSQPGTDYTMVLHTDVDNTNGNVDALEYSAQKGYGFVAVDPGATGRGGWERFGPFDDTPNDRNLLSDACPEGLYDSFVGFKNFPCLCDQAVAGGTTSPCLAGQPSDCNGDGVRSEPYEVSGGIFRVDVPNGLYRFVGAFGDAANPHAHRVLAEDGGSGPPGNVGSRHVVLVENHDQAQYDIGETLPADCPGCGVYARVGFNCRLPPLDDRSGPDPVFVNMDEDGRPTAGEPESPTLAVTRGYIRFHLLQGNSNPGPGGRNPVGGIGAPDPNGADVVALEIWKVAEVTVENEFRRGDANADGHVDIGDVAFADCFLFGEGPPPPCQDAADANNDGIHGISDPTDVFRYLFAGLARPPPPPGPSECGGDDGLDDLNCERYEACEPLSRSVEPGFELSFGAPPPVEGAPGSTVTFEVPALLCNAEALAGWSLSIEASGCRIVDVTYAGTVTEQAKYVAEKASGEGGSVSGVLFDDLPARSLPERICGDPHTVLRLTVEATIPATSGECTLRFADGQEVPGMTGQPAENLVVTACDGSPNGSQVHKPVGIPATIGLVPSPGCSLAITGCPASLGQHDEAILEAVVTNASGGGTYAWEVASGPAEIRVPGQQHLALVSCGGEGLSLVRVTYTEGVDCSVQAVCSFGCAAAPGGTQRPGDCDQNGRIELTDGICLLGHFFRGTPARLPCGNGSTGDAPNKALFDMDGNDGLDLTDAVRVFQYLFAGGSPHPLCTDPQCSECVSIEGCPDNSAKCP